MADRGLTERANDVLDRLFMLDGVLAEARAFRALLESLHGRDLSAVKEPHISAIIMMRAPILRSLIASVMSVLDPEDARRGNRASVGQILHLLKDPRILTVLTEGGRRQRTHGPTVDAVRGRYKSVLRGPEFTGGRRLRNAKVAHTLLEEVPTVEYSEIYALHDGAEQLVIDLHEVCTREPPRFIADRQLIEDRAKLVWDTYLAGMTATRVTEIQA